MSTIQECQYQECQCRKDQGREFAKPLRSGVINLFRRILWISRRYARWVKIKEQQRQLMAMDDRMLNDIGLSRADAVRITSTPRFWSFILGRAEDNKDK